MSKGRDRDYEREVIEAAKRMKKYPEHLRSARDSDVWKDFLINIGVKEDIVDSSSGSDFWESVREKVDSKHIQRLSIYQQARSVGMPAKIARRIRDWSKERAIEAIERWQMAY